VPRAITDKPERPRLISEVTLVGGEAVTPRTEALARQHLDLRLLILPALPLRLAALRALDDDERLRAAAAALSADLDGHFTIRELDDLLRQEGFPAPQMVAHVGHSASKRRRVRAQETLELVAEYFRLRLGGFSSARAHILAAERHGYEVEALRVFRQRFRDDAREILPE
jgi:hypothetical protein